MAKFVLVVEDDPDQRRFMERALGAAGWRVITAPDGEAGVRIAEAERPAVIVLDVMMPLLNGFQTCRKLRQSATVGRTPIVILTSKDQPTDALWATEVGADAFMHKPVDIHALLGTLERLGGPA
ncbi:MAG: response regulator [Gemmatimonadetes bacterium]|nr:response regulator [Gemmatimonadota bacterium]